MTRHTKWAALLAAMALVAAAQAAPVSGQGSWETTLQARDLNGDSVTDAFYDTSLNITWLRNANVNGAQNWATADNWANGLVFGDYSDWRLPTMVDTGAPGCDSNWAGGTDCGFNVQTATIEMAHLYCVTLGNKALCDPATSTATTCSVQAGFGLTNAGDFENLQTQGSNFSTWFGPEYAPNPSFVAWFFNAGFGGQGGVIKSVALFALAVRPGDVPAAIPEPQAVILALTALIGMALTRRRRPR